MSGIVYEFLDKHAVISKGASQQNGDESNVQLYVNWHVHYLAASCLDRRNPSLREKSFRIKEHRGRL